MAAASSLVSSPPQHTQVVEGIFFLSNERSCYEIEFLMTMRVKWQAMRAEGEWL